MTCTDHHDVMSGTALLQVFLTCSKYIDPGSTCFLFLILTRFEHTPMFGSQSNSNTYTSSTSTQSDYSKRSLYNLALLTGDE